MDKKCLCIVMDYADGGDLYTKIANQKKVGKGNFKWKLKNFYSNVFWRLNSWLVCSNGFSYKAYSWSKNFASWFKDLEHLYDLD